MKKLPRGSPRKVKPCGWPSGPVTTTRVPSRKGIWSPKAPRRDSGRLTSSSRSPTSSRQPKPRSPSSWAWEGVVGAGDDDRDAGDGDLQVDEGGAKVAELQVAGDVDDDFGDGRAAAVVAGLELEEIRPVGQDGGVELANDAINNRHRGTAQGQRPGRSASQGAEGQGVIERGGAVVVQVGPDVDDRRDRLPGPRIAQGELRGEVVGVEDVDNPVVGADVVRRVGRRGDEGMRADRQQQGRGAAAVEGHGVPVDGQPQGGDADVVGRPDQDAGPARPPQPGRGRGTTRRPARCRRRRPSGRRSRSPRRRRGRWR